MARTLQVENKTYNITSATKKAKLLLAKRQTITQSHPDYGFVHWIYRQRRGELVPLDIVFKVDIGADNRYNCFWAQLKDSSWDAFSYKKAFEPSTQKIRRKSKQDYLKAFRLAVYHDIKSFREKELAKNSRLKKLSQQDPFNVHTDHVVPFHLLVSDFLKDRSLTFDDVELEKQTIFNMEQWVVKDSRLKSDWIAYHRRHAKLQLLQKTDNLRKAGAYDIPLYRYKKTRGETYDS